MNIKPESVLKDVWGFTAFKPPQKDIIQSILSGKDTIALLPTGGGKSLCFQVPALCVKGKVLVVSPLISLMLDQVKALESRGVMAKALHGGLNKEDIDIILDNFVHGPLKLLYVSPERLSSELFLERFYRTDIAFLAVDEAHCISQWGHDFRPSYLQIRKLKEIKPKLPIIALTATATSNIIKDIAVQLELQSPNVFSKSFARENISFSVIRTEDKIYELMRIIPKLKGSGIIYLRNRVGCAKLANWLNEKKISTTYYHAGLDFFTREANQKAWMNGEKQIIVATNAFGMGIDKPDVRFVIHLEITSNLEDYYQEAGRGGRDGKPTYAIALYKPNDIHAVLKNFETQYPSIESIKECYINICKYLKLAVGGGAGHEFYFNIDSYIKAFNISQSSTIAALRILEKHGWIVLSEGLYSPSKVIVVANSTDINYGYQEDDPRYIILLQLLRSYEAIFIEFVNINEAQMSRALNIDVEKIIFYLKVLEREGMIHYNPSAALPKLTFMFDRPQDDSFLIDKMLYAENRNNAKKRLESVIQFFTMDTCRQQSLLQYFDEKSKPCGKCDFCMGSAELEYSKEEFKKVCTDIFNQTKAMQFRDYLNSWPYNKRKRIEAAVNNLILEGHIKIFDNGLIVVTKSMNEKK